MENLGNRLAGLQTASSQIKARATEAATEAARTGLSILVVRDLVLALLVGGVGLCLFGLDQVLAFYLNPAAAAFTVGGVTLAGVALAGYLGVQSLQKKLQQRLSGKQLP